MRGATRKAWGTRTHLVPLLVSSAVMAWPAYVEANDEPELAISVGEPRGFEVLTDNQTLIVDLYFGGRSIGEAEITTTKGHVTFADPHAVAALITGLKIPEQVRMALSGEMLASNSHLVCSQGSDRSVCGKMNPAELGIILDRDNFRLDIFLNPQLLELSSTREDIYLPPPAEGVSFINSIGGVISGTIDGGSRNLHDFSDRLLIARGQSRLIAEFGHSSELGLRSEEFVFQMDMPERRVLAGAFWAPGSELIGHQKLLGIGIQSQIDTRVDREEILGSQLVVFLSQRSKIDILREGRILSSAVYEAGNQRLDTSSLPEGAYEITLRITETGGGAREEIRFFNKSRRVPSIGRQDFFAFAGLRIDDPFSIEPTGDPFAQAGWARRLSERFAIDAVTTFSGDELSIQAGGTFITPVAIVRGAILGASDGTTGGLLQVSSGGFSRLNFNAELRHMSWGEELPLFSDGVLGEFDLENTSGPFAARREDSFWQGGATVSYGLGNLQLFGSAFFRKSEGEPTSYGIGPSFRWEFLQRDALRVAFNGNAAATERGTTGYLGLSLSLVGGNRSLSAGAGSKLSNVSGETGGFAGTLSGAWQETGILSGDLNIGAGYEREPSRDNMNVSANFRNDTLSLAGDLLHGAERGHSQTQYSAAAQTVFAIGPGTVELHSRNSSDSLVVARVNGARESDRFEVLVNDATAGLISGGDSLSLALPSYRAYVIRLRAVGGELVSYDGSDRRIGLYPGNVQVLEWDVRPIRIIIGRLLFDDGSPIAGARLRAPGGLAETDLEGNFQIELTGETYLDVSLASGHTYRVHVPEPARTTEWALVGDLHCCSAPTPGALASASVGN